MQEENSTQEDFDNKLKRYFTIPEINDEEIISLSIIVQVFEGLEDFERERIVKYLEARYGE